MHSRSNTFDVSTFRLYPVVMTMVTQSSSWRRSAAICGHTLRCSDFMLLRSRTFCRSCLQRYRHSTNADQSLNFYSRTLNRSLLHTVFSDSEMVTLIHSDLCTFVYVLCLVAVVFVNVPCKEPTLDQRYED